MKKKLLIMVLTVITAMGMCFSLSGCGGGDNEAAEGDGAKTLNVMQQYGLAYAPFQVMEEQGLIEKAYEEATGNTVEVNYSVLNSGSTINESFASGDVQVGAMGVGPAVTGVMTGVGYKICSNMSAQPHKLMTNADSGINTLSDIQSSDQIALVNIGSFQHVLLAMACEAQLGDAHALDENILASSHPDGMVALENGQVAAQLTTSPYTFMEEAEGMVEVDALQSVWPDGNSFIVAVASEELHNDDPELYAAVVQGISDAIDYINENPEETAELLAAGDDMDQDAETILSWLQDPACSYSTELKGVMTMANFMAENGFLEVDGPSDISELVFDGVKGN